jgi:hypothetical protein
MLNKINLVLRHKLKTKIQLKIYLRNEIFSINLTLNSVGVIKSLISRLKKSCF